ncbi:hypothetical protein Ahy_B09g095769 isoform A [Arachis hypogaea]|uniref:Uncharacterized protein n=1 Tax=Arachis hypogaea TaxID=3818 RepID=A0A444XHD6_ARAHY|nr:hypothetical protein Ahy_B09g095769 isoform A [Arachis hypogaea]
MRKKPSLELEETLIENLKNPLIFVPWIRRFQPWPPPPPPPHHRRSPPPKHSAHRSPPPPLESPPTPSDAQASELGSPPRDYHRYWIPPPPPSRQQSGMNTGKKVGLLFVGIVAVMQIAMVSFLVFQRNQLLKGNDRYENYS